MKASVMQQPACPDNFDSALAAGLCERPHHSAVLPFNKRMEFASDIYRPLCSVDDETFVPSDLFARWAAAGFRAKTRNAHIPMQDYSGAVITAKTEGFPNFCHPQVQCQRRLRRHSKTFNERGECAFEAWEPVCSVDDETLVPPDLFTRWADAGYDAKMRATHVPIRDCSGATITLITGGLLNFGYAPAPHRRRHLRQKKNQQAPRVCL